MKMEFLESFKKFFFNSGNNEPVRETSDHTEIKEEVGVATDTFDPYYEEMCVNDYHLKFCEDAKVADITKTVYCKDCKHFLGEQCSLPLEDSTKIMVRKIIDSKITKPELIRFHDIILQSNRNRKIREDDVFKMILESAKKELSFDEHLSICLFYLIVKFGKRYTWMACVSNFTFSFESTSQIDFINELFKFYRTLDRRYIDESTKIVGRKIDEVPLIPHAISNRPTYPSEKDHLMLNCNNNCPFFKECVSDI